MFIRWVFLSLVAHAIWATTVRSGEGDLMAGNVQACFFYRETWVVRLTRDNQWQRDTEIRDILEKWFEGTYDRKVRFCGGFGLIFLRLR